MTHHANSVHPSRSLIDRTLLMKSMANSESARTPSPLAMRFYTRYPPSSTSIRGFRGTPDSTLTSSFRHAWHRWQIGAIDSVALPQVRHFEFDAGQLFGLVPKMKIASPVSLRTTDA